jgi:tight adherence protein C
MSTTSLLLAIGLLAIFCAIVLLLATVGGLTAERLQVGRSLAAIRATHSLPESMRAGAEVGFGERVLEPMVARLTRIGRRITPTGQFARIRKRLDAAGSPARWDVDRILAFKVLGLIVLTVLALLLGSLGGATPAVVVIAAIAGAALGFWLPDLTLYQLAAKRTERMQKDLPDAMDLLTISVEAGLSFDAALAQVARNTEGPLAEEFFRVLKEVQLGVPRDEALRALAERTDFDDLKSFVSAMVQADVYGVPIASVLRAQAREMRTKRRQRAEEKGQKVPVKILFPLIFCIMPALFIVVLGPAAIEIYRNLIGSGVGG